MTPRTRARPVILLVAGAALSVLAAGCTSASDSQAEESPATASPSESESTSRSARSPKKPSSPAEQEADLTVTVQGSDVGPNAAALDVRVGEPLVIEVDSDRAGELHVHSKPEQYVKFGRGTTRQELVVETPGVVEIEEHETGAVVAQVQVGG